MDDWLTRGFYGKKPAVFLEEDFKIREKLKEILPKGVVESVEIERQGSSVKVIIKTSRPALIIGRRGEEVEKIRKTLEKTLGLEQKGKREKDEKKVIKIEIITIKDPWSSASLSSQWIAGQIEKRVAFRRVLKMALSKIMALKEVEGARVEVAGRLNGNTIARTEWLQEGKLPRQKIKGIIDYGFSEAHCTYGKIGVKVWIYKGEKEEK